MITPFQPHLQGEEFLSEDLAGHEVQRLLIAFNNFYPKAQSNKVVH